MRNWMQVLTLAAAGLLGLASTHASETPYYKNVSDMEVETAVKGETYNKGPSKWFDHSSKSDCCCEGTVTTTTTSPAPSTAGGPRVKYILDGKPVYEDGSTAPAPTAPSTPAKPSTEKQKTSSVSDEDLAAAVGRLGSSGWRDAQVLLVSAGKAAMPFLIDGLNRSEDAYNLGGHTKADTGRAPRTRTIGEVCAELLTDIVANHSSFNGELPTLSQDAWRDWWTKNGASVTFAD